MLLQDILRLKGSEIYSITPEKTVAEAVDSLVEHNCGSLIVCEAGSDRKMVGIITERDVLKAISANKSGLGHLKVQEVMTTNLITGSPDQSLSDTMGQLTNNRIRHLPVVGSDGLVGIISIGDVVKSKHDELSAENEHLKNYIQS